MLTSMAYYRDFHLKVPDSCTLKRIMAISDVMISETACVAITPIYPAKILPNYKYD